MNAAVWSDYPASAAWLSEYMEMRLAHVKYYFAKLFRSSAECLGPI
jgi:hypothetical protein